MSARHLHLPKPDDETNSGVPVIKFPQIFRHEDLSARHLYDNVTSPAAQMPPLRTQTNLPMHPTTTAFVPKSPSPAPSTESAASSWATVGKSNTAKNIDIAPDKKKGARRCILLNVNNERVDEMLPQPDRMAQKRFEDRMKEQAKSRHVYQQSKCCNEYHLAGRCSKGEEYCGKFPYYVTTLRPR